MKKDTFESIWKQGIAKSAQDVFDGISPALREKYSVRIDVSDAMCMNLYHEYENVRCSVREKYFDTGKTGGNKIDGHKICACITGALLNVRMITYRISGEEMPVKVVYAHYEIAFLAAIYVMYLFLLSDFGHEGNMECYNELKNAPPLYFLKQILGMTHMSKGG